jgi:amino acid adenylation domain-containing protein
MGTIPRWTLHPVAGVGAHEAAVPEALVTALRRRCDELAMPLRTVLLTAHCKVLAALAGERDVIAGYAIQGAAPSPLRVTLGQGSWAEVLEQVARAELALLSRAPDVAAAPFESVFEATRRPAAGVDPADGIVLRVAFAQREGLVLQLRYRTEVLDEACAARIAGYHLAALALIAADPDAAHDGGSLLSQEELRFQLHDLAGPPRKLPEHRVHELFEAQAAAHPDAVAAVRGTRRLTYAELNARANRLARSLLAHGLPREGVVAVVSERNLDWLAAVLGIFKAGGAYLPIEPHFPAERIAQVIARSGCRLVLAERGGTRTLDPALASLASLSGMQKVFIDAACDGTAEEGNLAHSVAPDQLAYVYFTSGSTGEPKGAMCEHAGMLNHLFAKIDDLGIGRDTVVAQTAPQCFDISLWQLLSALLVGGQTRIVGQDAIMDARHFLDEIVAGRVNVVQVVPSYLEVLVTCLERQPRELPDLRCVSVTGEALKKELTQRWFEAQSAIRLVNAYGLTETCDDTNHEVLYGVPRRERVPVGRPVNNVHVYVVDEQLAPVPLGAPGEIVFSGICVGRGYINDPERTRLAFMPDPHRPGQRLYRSGDFGRWLPDGKLEFLGRQDSQVKVNGFRVELGEIESALLRLPGVRDGAAVVTERDGRDRQLVAFYCGDRPLAADGLRQSLGASLPRYMVPAAFHWRKQLPLTGNGKVDRKALRAIVRHLDDAAEPDSEPMRTPTERLLAGAWAAALGIPQERIDRHAHFFELGGTSLSALRLAIKLDRGVSVKDLADHPVLSDLARLIDARAQLPPRAAPVHSHA